MGDWKLLFMIGISFFCSENKQDLNTSRKGIRLKFLNQDEDKFKSVR